jgi:hypothetical protein
MDVLVFVTNVYLPQQVSKVQALLTTVPAIEDWNFDLEDCDHILRIESNDLSPREVEALLKSAGLDCCELE